MTRKRRQERIATSRLTLPLTALYGAVVALLAGAVQQGLWVQAACLFIATETIAMLNNHYSLTRVYSRMLSCTYLMLSAAVCFRGTNTNESIVPLCFIAFYFIIFQAYQNRRGAGPVFYAFAMIGIASIFFVKILYFVPFLWIALAAYILAFSLRQRPFSDCCLPTGSWQATMSTPTTFQACFPTSLNLQSSVTSATISMLPSIKPLPFSSLLCLD